MKTPFYLFIFIFIAPLSPAFSSQIILGLGEQQALRVRGDSRVWVQDRDILSVDGEGSQLRILGRKEGFTTLKAGTSLYQIQVVHPGKKTALTKIQQLLETSIGLKAGISEGDLLITGTLYRLQDWIQLSEEIRSQNISYQMRAQMSAQLKEEAQNYFSRIIKAAHLAPQTLIFEPSLEVRISTTDLAYKKYLNLLTPFGISVLRDAESLDVAPTIKVQITVAEIKKDLFIKYGLRWPSSYSAKILPTNEVLRDELPFNLTALEGQGMGKILASPNIICRSGKEAEFLAGGEFPIKIMNYKIQDIVWKRFGILLRVKPKADSAGRISLSIETEVSTVDDSRKVDDIPGILTNRVSSHFDLTKPQTIALSGLLKNESGKSSEGLPFLSRLPILGALFSSKDFKENRSELVIFVRPSILDETDTSASPEHLQSLNDRKL